MTSTRSLRPIGWGATLAIVAVLIAPVGLRAMSSGASPGSPWEEICTSLGLQRAQATTQSKPDAPGQPAGARHAGDCPECLPGTFPAALPSQPASTPPTARDGTTRFLFFFIGEAPSAVPFGNAYPRAPPALG
jgi:hypothetical protein